ncbi:MAG: hypothetical protein HW383_675 [Candidatus Magasanikbacteria bacterium]|nr:hypothetical protein [Candidatus Magasanikbacteria bacterium]
MKPFFLAIGLTLLGLTGAAWAQTMADKEFTTCLRIACVDHANDAGQAPRSLNVLIKGFLAAERTQACVTIFDRFINAKFVADETVTDFSEEMLAAFTIANVVNQKQCVRLNYGRALLDTARWSGALPIEAVGREKGKKNYFFTRIAFIGLFFGQVRAIEKALPELDAMGYFGTSDDELGRFFQKGLVEIKGEYAKRQGATKEEMRAEACRQFFLLATTGTTLGIVMPMNDPLKCYADREKIMQGIVNLKPEN